jgi:hypothetical protein
LTATARGAAPAGTVAVTQSALAETGAAERRARKMKKREMIRPFQELGNRERQNYETTRSLTN